MAVLAVGIAGSGCDRSTGVSRKDAGAPLDVAISLGGAVGTGGLTTLGGTGGSASGGSTGVAFDGAGPVGSGGAGAVGGAGGAEARGLDASLLDAPAVGGAPDTDGESGGGGAGGTGVTSITGGVMGTGGGFGTGGGAGGASSIDGAIGGSSGSTSPGTRPCDIYTAANPATPCVAAYSMVRLLSSTYGGPLYQVRKGGGTRNTGTGGTTQDIRATPDGFADAVAQDAFCDAATCTVSILYDQSGMGNDLTVAKKGCYADIGAEDDFESSATKGSVTVDGHKVHGLYMDAHEGYRNNRTSGMPTGDVAQGVYEVVDGKRYSTACCWEFGNATTDNCWGGMGRENALFFGVQSGLSAAGAPSFTGDFGLGPWASEPGWGIPEIPPPLTVNYNYAVGILKTKTGSAAIRFGDAQSGDLLTVWYGSVGISTWYLQGGIVLGIASDNSNLSYGTFFEGAIVSGHPADATDAAILANVQAARYGR